MISFENELDEIRVKLFEETKGMSKEEIIRCVNSNAQKIAHEFGINIKSTANTKENLQTINA